jgi:hypothetical protein
VKRLEARIGLLESAHPACRHCAGRPSVVIIEGTADEVADPTYLTGRLPYPRMCPSCGQRTIHLVREYREGDPKPRPEDEPDGGGL